MKRLQFGKQIVLSTSIDGAISKEDVHALRDKNNLKYLNSGPMVAQVGNNFAAENIDNGMSSEQNSLKTLQFGNLTIVSTLVDLL